MTFLAQLSDTVKDSDYMDLFLPFIKSLGLPGALLLIVAYTAKKTVTWAMPRVEKLIEAWIARQATMAECQQKLTESTIDIQKESLTIHKKNSEVLGLIQKDMPRMCQGFRAFSQQTTKEEEHHHQQST
jgi:hypothetical protein